MYNRTKFLLLSQWITHLIETRGRPLDCVGEVLLQILKEVQALEEAHNART